jgi:hypothetical protein
MRSATKIAAEDTTMSPGIGFGHWIWALDLGIGFGHWIWALDLGIGFGHWIWALVAGLDCIIV